MKKFGLLISCVVLFSSQPFFAQEGTVGTRITGSPVVEITNGQLMEHWMPIIPPELKKRNFDLGLKEPDRENLPQAPGALELSQWPTLQSQNLPEEFTNTDAPQTYGVNFTGAVLSDALAFPPDVMGAVGPAQFIVFVNGRIRSFNKTTGIADGVLNIDPDVFFSLVTTPPGAGEVAFTSDPNVRYDRLTGRWFLSIIDVTQNTTTGSLRANRNLFAWSDGPIISGSTVWNFTYYQNATYFDDYPSLGIDANALYVGTNRFNAGVGGSLTNMVAYVWNKASFISGSPTGYIYTLYNGTTGAFSPRGVDNLDPTNTGSTAVGYFIGVDVSNYGLLILNRVTNPAGAPPTMSSNISITVATTNAPVKVPHLGNTGGTNGRLDALDDRLFAAQLKNGRLWTAHNVGVRNNGVSSTTSNSRNAARWYELSNLSGTPSIIQTGTLYDNSSTATNTDQRNYWIPSIAVSGQGHAALGCSIAGTNERINAFTTGRLSGDALGTLRNGPGGSSIPGYTSTTTAYNPSSDPGGTSGRRWGDYSFTSVDPNDDMTMWTIQEFCDATNSWGVRVVQLIAPPPVTPATANPNIITPDLTSVNVVITGTVVNGSGFFDPGTGFPNHISASLPGGIVVNSVTYNSPTQVTLSLNTTGVAAGFYTVTITNPDGQSATSLTGILKIDPNLPVELTSFSATTIGSNVKLSWNTATEVNNYGFDVERKSNVKGQTSEVWEKIGFVEGNGNSNSPKDYSFVDDKVIAGNYSYRLKQIDNDGQFEYSKTIEVDMNGVNKFELSQNYPNPFNPATTISFNLPEAGNVKLTLFNIVGQQIRTLVNEFQESGVHTVNFNASDLSSGMYIYKIESNGLTQTRKMTLVR